MELGKSTTIDDDGISWLLPSNGTTRGFLMVTDEDEFGTSFAVST